ncbi:MAG: helix-turn-helix transcriptional regulator [Fimbriimonadaceae bacterium]|nr:helix-turn-helix transcriptional regulator [Fimbriimonadaceae bacterium]
MPARFSLTSLAEPLDIPTCGAFADDADTQAWAQPRGLFQALLLEDKGTFTMNADVFPVEGNDLVIVPPGSHNEVSWSAGSTTRTIVYFTFRASDSPQDEVALPLHTRLGEEGRVWNVNLRRALSRIQTSRTSAQVVAKALLWAVAVPPPVGERNVYVTAAERLVAENLAEPIRIGDLAKSVGICQGQLNRLFVTVHGKTPLQYVRDVRAEHAHHLLTTTTLSLKQVGAACGYPNPHHFNRFVRDRLGASPRAIRNHQVQVDMFRVKTYSSTLDKR